MSLRTVIRKGVKIADDVTASLQPNVSVSAWTGQDRYGTKTFAAAVLHAAHVEQKVRQHTTSGGRIVTTIAKISFLRPIAANGATGRVEPIDPRDKVVLPDGTTGPIVDVEGYVDAGTGRPFYTVVWLGVAG